MNRLRLLITGIVLAAFLITPTRPLVAAPATAQRAIDVALQPSLNPAASAGINQPPRMAPGVVLVGLKPGIAAGTGMMGAQASDASLSTAFASLRVQSVEPVFPQLTDSSSVVSTAALDDLSHVYRLRLPPDADILGAVEALKANPAVAYAEPDYIAHVIATPDDTYYAGQWGLTQINAPAAWDVVTGTTSVAIAVIDSGLDTTHPDLAGQLWVNPGEIAGNGLDDDNDGYVDDVNGANIYAHNTDLTDSTGHGTEVAGIIAAATNNGAGIAGVCWQCRLMVVKVTQPGGISNYSDIAAGVAYAAQKGAKVINLSLGGSTDSTTLRSAIAAAAQTAVVVGGAGNDNSSALFYPAAYDDALAVAGTTSTDAKVGTSNYGTWVDVSAPGEVITTTFSGGGYGSSSGTSMAVPFASGLAGLLRSQHPDWSPAQVRAQIIHTADNIDGLNPGHEGQLGSGRINAQKAVTTAAHPLLSNVDYTVNGQSIGRPEPGSTVDLFVTLKNDWADATNTQATLSTSSGYVAVSSASSSYGAIAAFSRQQNATAFRLAISGSTPYNTNLVFNLHVSASGGFAYDLPLTITTSPGISYIHGTINTTTWTNDRVYIVDNNAGVAAGQTLTIQPGTTVRFKGNFTLTINGTLIADGTALQPIRFTRELPYTWGQIKFAGTSTPATFDGSGNYTGGSIIRNAIIEYGQGIYLEMAGPFIANNTFQNIVGPLEFPWAIDGPPAPGLVISDNTFTDSGIQIWGTMQTGILILRNQMFGGRIRVTSSSTISGNLVSNCTGQGINANNPVLVSGNRVVGCTEGIVANGGIISGNLVANNTQYGLHVMPGTITVTNNTLAFNNGAGVSFEGGYDYTVTLQNNNLVASTEGYAVRLPVNYANNVDATGNYWGTTNDAAIQDAIYDGIDEFGPGIVNYNGYLAGAVQTAPPYVQNVAIQPDTTLGVQTATFNVQFSRPMSQSTNPTITFGATSPYTSYVVLDNAQWLDATHWCATYDITSLVPRDTYTLTVSGAKGTDGMEIPSDTRFGFTVDYAGQITDQTPPSTPLVFATGKPGDESYVEVSWSAIEPDSSITGYRYAIGSAAGATDIVNWTTTTSYGVARSGLGLVAGQQYWSAVQAQNMGGLWSAVGYSSFIAGQQTLWRIHLPLVMR